MSSSQMVYELKSALLSTGLLQPLSEEVTPKSVSILCRGVPGQDRAWVRTIEDLLSKAPMNLHLCKKFVFKGGKVAFGWHLSVEEKTSKALKGSVTWLCTYFATVKPELNSTESQEAIDDEDIERAKRTRVSAAPQKPNVPKGMPPPRLPDGNPGMAHQPAPPENFQFAMKSIDKDTTEIPLPHVYRDLNSPNAKGRGATLYGSSKK